MKKVNTRCKVLKVSPISGHLMVSHNFVEMDTISSDICDYFKCTLCPFQSASKKQVVTHLRAHCDKSRPFQCIGCEDCFLTKASCEKHIRYVILLRCFCMFYFSFHLLVSSKFQIACFSIKPPSLQITLYKINIWCCTYMFIVCSRHFFKIFLKFWSKCIRILKIS